MRLPLALLLTCLPIAAAADIVVPTRTIRAGETIPPAAVTVAAGTYPGAATTTEEVIGQESRVALYPGRPILTAQVGAPALVERNGLVTIVFDSGGLRIATEGRALSRGGAGERIRVMNLASKTSLFGTIRPDGTVSVSEEP